ncbi:hypothetical protein MHO82_01875 [Vibrio sp. Of7-15]|uniref:hypothetical protein n=1 Tax=Vibrio sp. Of7-15 TaxID=2724879 RepID=UPI001EF1E0E5|nr:hypothetical protein [Vibrio sp. Of7-15]MCG7495609.1 hypothetical protein [Vibrio sp. Of7-15]
MIVSTYREDGSQCTTEAYETAKINRMACFGARHADGCDASTALLSTDGTDEDKNDDGETSSDLKVDLDKASNNSLYLSKNNHKHSLDESVWVGTQQAKGLGSGSGFPLNKSLRALLTNLCRNPEYADKGQTIKIVASGGRPIIEGTLSEYLVPISTVSREHVGKEYIFWGSINNLNVDKNGTLWLNYGDYRKEPSISLSSSLKDELLEKFKLKEVSELDGSDFIVVGHVGFSENNKAIISTGFTKYLSFRKVEVVLEFET